MNQAAPTTADAVLDDLPLPAFRALLEGVSAPHDGFAALGLSDLAQDRYHVIGEPLGAPALDDLCKDLFNQTDGRQLAQLRGHGEDVLGVQIAGRLILLVAGEDQILAVAVPVGTRTDVAQLVLLKQRICQHLHPGGAASLLAECDLVQWVMSLEPASGKLLEHVIRSNAPRSLQSHLDQLLQQDAPALFLSLLGYPPGRPVNRALLQAVLLKHGERCIQLYRLPFVPRLILAVEAEGNGAGDPVWRTARRAAEDVLRDVIGLVLGSGLSTLIQPFPQTDVEFEQILEQLRNLPKDDLDQRLILGGFANHEVQGPDGAMRCRECIYFLPHRRWCDLPELPVPVEADWYCRLWKL